MVLTYCLILEYFRVSPVWILSSELPNIKEGLPVNIGNQFANLAVVDNLGTQERRVDCKTRCVVNVICFDVICCEAYKIDVMNRKSCEKVSFCTEIERKKKQGYACFHLV